MSRPLKLYDYYKNGQKMMNGTRQELMDHLCVSNGTITRWMKNEHPEHQFKYVGKVLELQLYELYLDDKFIMKGTYEEIMNAENIDKNRAQYLRASPKDSPNRIVLLEGEIVIVKRTHKAKYAPIPEKELEVEKPKQRKRKITVAVDKPLETKNWNMNDYHKELFNSMFKKWRA